MSTYPSHRDHDDFSKLDGVSYSNYEMDIPISGVVDGKPRFGFFRGGQRWGTIGDRTRGVEIIWEHKDSKVKVSYQEFAEKIKSGEFIVRQDREEPDDN
jgi:hypothetical protein